MAAIALAALVLAGCSGQPEELASSYQQSQSSGDVSTDGTVTSWPASQRGPAVEFSGPATNGEQLSSATYLGDVVVVNFWYAGCPPCRVEAPELVATAEAYADAPVALLGVNTRDQMPQAVAFEREFGIGYPSILDNLNQAAVQRAFVQVAPLTATPTTLVLDREGRVAHRILGQITDVSVLFTLIDETLAEKTSE